MNSRISNLLDDLSEAETHLRDALTAEQKGAAEADIRAFRHSLFLASYHFQTEEA